MLFRSWYDKNACHRRQPEIWDRTNGRVYRVSYGDRKPVKVDLSKLSDDELIALHTHKNEWQVRMARKVLQERAAKLKDEDVVNLWKRLVALVFADKDKPFDAEHTRQTLRYMWTTHCISADRDLPVISSTFVFDAWYGMASVPVRTWAVQLAAENTTTLRLPTAFTHFQQLVANEPAPQVRLAWASVMQRYSIEGRGLIAEALLNRAEDADDHNIPLMIWYGIEPLVGADPNVGLRLASNSKIPKVTQLIYRRLASDDAGRAALLEAVAKTTDDATQRQDRKSHV